MLALASALLLAACGGGGGGEDPQQVIHETFSNPTPIRSGTLDLDVKIETSGGQSPGTLEVKLGGKFQSQGSGRFPKFDFDVSLRAESGSQNITGSGGLTSTGDGAFVNVQGTEYSVPRQLYDEFVTSYTQLQGQRGQQGTGLLQRLSIDPSRWLTDLKNEGTEDVEGTNTIHISGKANVPQIVDDLKTIAQRAGSAVGNVDLGRLNQLNGVIQSGDVDVNSGESDKLLRRFQASFDLKPPAARPERPTRSPSTCSSTSPTSTSRRRSRRRRTRSRSRTSCASTGSTSATALRGGLGTSGALPESGGSTTAPRRTGVSGLSSSSACSMRRETRRCNSAPSSSASSCLSCPNVAAGPPITGQAAPAGRRQLAVPALPVDPRCGDRRPRGRDPPRRSSSSRRWR